MQYSHKPRRLLHHIAVTADRQRRAKPNGQKATEVRECGTAWYSKQWHGRTVEYPTLPYG